MVRDLCCEPNEGGPNVARVGVKSREIDKPIDKEHFEQSVRGRIALQWIIRDRKEECGLPECNLGEGQVVGC